MHTHRVDRVVGEVMQYVSTLHKINWGSSDADYDKNWPTTVVKGGGHHRIMPQWPMLHHLLYKLTICYTSYPLRALLSGLGGVKL